jgi:hypothetical protein
MAGGPDGQQTDRHRSQTPLADHSAEPPVPKRPRTERAARCLEHADIPDCSADALLAWGRSHGARIDNIVLAETVTKGVFLLSECARHVPNATAVPSHARLTCGRLPPEQDCDCDYDCDCDCYCSCRPIH